MKSLSLGIDIGGTNCAFGIVSNDGEIIKEFNIETARFSNATDFARYVRQQTISFDLKHIGIGAPNGNFYAGEIEFAPNLNWGERIPLQKIFEKEFKLSVVVTNDANAAAIGEKLFGAGKEFSNFIEITLGTGLGSGIIINDELIHGATGFAGELGHISIDWKGRECGCSKLGCLEGYVSATGMVRSIKELHSTNSDNTTLNNNVKTAREIFQHAKNGDVFAQEIIDYTAETLGRSLAEFTAFSEPQAYILFGGIAQSGEEFRLSVEKAMEKHQLSIYKNKVKVLISDLHNKNAAILGASALAFQTFSK